MRHFCFLALLVCILSLCHGEAMEPTFTKSKLGVVTGTVTQIDPASITVKVPQMVQSGSTRRRIGRRSIRVPRYTTKQVESTFSVASDVTVKMIGGKHASLSDVLVGLPVRLHVYKVTEHHLGEKAESHAEVRRIDIPKPRRM